MVMTVVASMFAMASCACSNNSEKAADKCASECCGDCKGCDAAKTSCCDSDACAACDSSSTCGHKAE